MNKFHFPLKMEAAKTNSSSKRRGEHLDCRLGRTLQDALAALGAAQRGGARVQGSHDGTTAGLSQLGSVAWKQ